MRSRFVLVAAIVCGAAVLSASFDSQTGARARGAGAVEPLALTGQVTSAEEGPMEGVLVSAKKTGAPITITVVTDREGRYRFPETRLEPGQYALRIRAVGYDLASAGSATVVARKSATADLKLQKARDLAAQLSNAEWLASFPGTDAQKASIRPCTHCHTLERIVRTTYDADRMMAVIEPMATY